MFSTNSNNLQKKVLQFITYSSCKIASENGSKTVKKTTSAMIYARGKEAWQPCQNSYCYSFINTAVALPYNLF